MENEIQIIKYNPSYKKIWDDFVESSKNGTFLFKRDYMDYHSDRFEDHSFLFYRKGKLYCLLPANRKDNVLYSHQGLTYGGLIMNEKCSAEGILEVFDILMVKLKEDKFTKFIYKPVPHIYHTLPAEEDLYALFRHNASLIARNISSSINLTHPLQFSKGRLEGVSKAKKHAISVEKSNDLKSFWEILGNNLKSKYATMPVHSFSEMQQLCRFFPENITLWGAYLNSDMIGGVLIYKTKTTFHTQYISGSPEGKKMGAVDLIIESISDYLYKQNEPEIKWFDFGSSNEDEGRYLNKNLIFQKEGFGGRAICYDTYELNIPLS